MAILVVEDEFLVAAEIRLHLERGGLGPIEVAATEQEALAALTAGKWDAAVVDANLNGQTSERVVEALSQKNVPLVIVTGYGRSGLPDTYDKIPVLDKPFRPRELVDVVSRYVAAKLS